MLALASPGLTPPARAATSAEVEAAIRRAKEFLYSQMKVDNWEVVPQPDPKGGPAKVEGKQWGGLTAISVYALLASGDNPQDARLAPAIAWLKKAKIEGNYALGLRAQIWQFLPETPERRGLVQADADQLLRSVHRQIPGKKPGNELGFYPYYLTPKGPAPGYDLSVSQYGVLGMWACDEAGATVPGEYWVNTDKAWKAAQNKEGDTAGGWPYRIEATTPDQMVKPTMTAAGVATLFITQDYILQMTPGQWASCKGGVPNPNLQAGLDYMDKHVKDLLAGNYYGMYGVERIGVASGRKYFEAVDWYAVGADRLAKSQGKDGSWTSGYGPVASTSFATIFMVRGRAPVMMNKLQYDLADPALKQVPEPWNERPRDVANFAKWAGKRSERFFNWQIVNLKVSPDDLHDAPILFIGGSFPLDFGQTEIDKLHEFVEAGGLILFNADCGSEAFQRSILGGAGVAHKIEPRYEFRELPANHPILTGQMFRASSWKNPPKVLGVSNGVREMMIFAPGADFSRAWQTSSDKTKEELFQLAQDLFLYSVDKQNLQYRGETYIVRPDPKVAATRTVKVARLEVGENWDPEPGGWRRLAAVMNNSYGMKLDVKPVKPGEGKLAGGAGGFQVAHLTGTTKFKLADAQRKEIRNFVDGGGTLVVDAAGGSTEFADSAEAQLAATFGGTAQNVGDTLPLNDDLFTPRTAPGAKIEAVQYRSFARGRITGKLNAPRLRGIGEGGRTTVFYSREDLSAGLVGQPVDGVLGYDPATATAIMRNILLYISPPPKPPATKPQAPPAG